MTVTLVSGKQAEFDHVWVKYPIMDLSEEHQKIVIEKIGREANIDTDKERHILSDYYCAGGRKWVPGDVEDKQFTVKNGKSTLAHKKPEDRTLIIHRKEAERILITYNKAIVWVDDYEHENRRYWISHETPEDTTYHHHKWSRLDAKSVVDSEGYEIDIQTQMLVHDFYIHGGKEGTIQFYDKRMSEIRIPQYADFTAKVKSDFSMYFEEEKPEDPEQTRRRYIKLVRSIVHEFDYFEKSKELMNGIYTDRWRIVHVPMEGQEPEDNDPYYSKTAPKIPNIDEIKTGDDLREWLKSNFITQDKAAELCGVTPRMFRRWLSGDPPIPKGSMELLFKKINP
jgi:hypothetical protein